MGLSARDRTTKGATCGDLVKERFEERMEELRNYQDNPEIAENGSDDGDIGPLAEYGLAFDYVEAYRKYNQDRPYFRFQLSWGGPSDEFRFYPNDVNQVYKIEYWYNGAKYDIGLSYDHVTGYCPYSKNGRILEWILEYFGGSLNDTSELQALMLTDSTK